MYVSHPPFCQLKLSPVQPKSTPQVLSVTIEPRGYRDNAPQYRKKPAPGAALLCGCGGDLERKNSTGGWHLKRTPFDPPYNTGASVVETTSADNRAGGGEKVRCRFNGSGNGNYGCTPTACESGPYVGNHGDVSCGDAVSSGALPRNSVAVATVPATIVALNPRMLQLQNEALGHRVTNTVSLPLIGSPSREATPTRRPSTPPE